MWLPSTLTYHYAGNGLDVVKTFRFDSSYVVDIETQVKRNGAPVRALVQWPAGLGDMEEFLPSSSTRSQMRTSAASEIAWSLNGKQDSMAAKKVERQRDARAAVQLRSGNGSVFCGSFPAQQSGWQRRRNAAQCRRPAQQTRRSDQQEDLLPMCSVWRWATPAAIRICASLPAQSRLTFSPSVHAIGPDGKATGQSLEPLIEFGFWGFIAKPLYIALRFMVLHGIGNWGWAIILFTMVFTIALLPTRFMMMKSQLKMMRIQPKVDAIKRKYANLKVSDPKRNEMNAEMMALYKEEGVNMYGGCLPILVQMPLFFAYFRVLQSAVELRQAHWFWLTDLSQPDPLHILPVLIILSMFLTQFITPTPGMDAAQRRMMAFMMPVIFGFMLWQYASGLSLYWGTSNVINLLLQVGINQSHYGKEMHEIAAKRAAKKAGASPKDHPGQTLNLQRINVRPEPRSDA